MAFTSREPGSQFLPAGLGAVYTGQVRRIKANGRTGDFTNVMYRGSARSLAATFAGALDALVGEGTTVMLRDPVDLPGIGSVLKRTVPFVRNFGRSDHAAFWERGFPAIMVNDTANFRNPNYHRGTDTPETLDYERLADITAATAFTVEALAGTTV
jgi:hypothetical protein